MVQLQRYFSFYFFLSPKLSWLNWEKLIVCAQCYCKHSWPALEFPWVLTWNFGIDTCFFLELELRRGSELQLIGVLSGKRKKGSMSQTWDALIQRLQWSRALVLICHLWILEVALRSSLILPWVSLFWSWVCLSYSFKASLRNCLFSLLFQDVKLA